MISIKKIAFLYHVTSPVLILLRKLLSLSGLEVASVEKTWRMFNTS
jgi:hypothetical protein